jgi:two-component system NtrC family sensor kinase
MHESGGMTIRSAMIAVRDARMLPARAAAASVAALVLGVALAYLYVKSPAVDVARQQAVLGHLRDLKQIDARWDVSVLRARAEFAALPAAAGDGDTVLARARKELAAAAGELTSPALEHGLPALDKALAEKTALVSGFLKANAAVKETLHQVLAAENEIAGLVRGAWRDFPDRERLIAVENIVVLLLADAQEYYFAPGESLRRNIDVLLEDLGDAAARLPPAVTSGLARLSGHVQALLKSKPGEQALYERLAYHTAGPRIDALSQAVSRELEAAQAARALNRTYLAACAGALLIVLIHLALLPLAARHGSAGPRQPGG